MFATQDHEVDGEPAILGREVMFAGGGTRGRGAVIESSIGDPQVGGGKGREEGDRDRGVGRGGGTCADDFL